MGVLTSLAYQALQQAGGREAEQNKYDLAWTAYLKITRHSPGCTKKEFINWIIEETNIAVTLRQIGNKANQSYRKP